jgi:hypothetical protein
MRRRFAPLVALLIVCLAVQQGRQVDAQQPSGSPPPGQWPEVTGRGVCYTETGWCPINGALPIGAACYCTIPPRTYIYGTVQGYQYYGRVNPYFNLHAPPVPSTIR